MVSTPTTESGSFDADRTALRPVPEVVDWVIGALLVLVGLASALAGSAMFFAIDRSEIRQAVADEEIQSDVLSNAELVEVTQALATWTAVGLIAIGAILFVLGFAYVVVRRRTHSRAAAGEQVSNFGANALLGALLAIVLSFVPFSQALGGIVAGYLEAGSSERVVGVGAFSGFLSVAPVLALLAFVLVGLVVGLLDVGAGALALVVAAALLLSLAILVTIGAGLGAIGGYVGGRLADRERDDAPTETEPRA